MERAYREVPHMADVALEAWGHDLPALFANAARLGPRVTRKLQALSALALLGFGLFQLWAGILS